jgi:hypothetical protein
MWVTDISCGEMVGRQTSSRFVSVFTSLANETVRDITKSYDVLLAKALAVQQRPKLRSRIRLHRRESVAVDVEGH